MKSTQALNTVISFLILFLWMSCKTSETGSVKTAEEFQAELNQQFSDPEESPLTEEDQGSFKELEFFAIDMKFRVKARLQIQKDSKPFAMKTTTDRLPIYKHYATAFFTLEGKECSLELYQNQELILDPEHSDYLFLPYSDKTNGDSSYGGGRYIDLSTPEGDEIIIDFNQSYNPYCAYNSKYSCPIPPESNELDVAVTAGVKAYGDHH